jgi:small multidrug resistance family-3 protein
LIVDLVANLMTNLFSPAVSFKRSSSASIKIMDESSRILSLMTLTWSIPFVLNIFLLFFATAACEIIGCFLPYLCLRKGGSLWLLLPAAMCLALFVWLLALHPAASGRVYAAYGGVYVVTALVWLRVVDGIRLSAYDLVGAGVVLAGVAIITAGWHTASSP